MSVFMNGIRVRCLRTKLHSNKRCIGCAVRAAHTNFRSQAAVQARTRSLYVLLVAHSSSLVPPLAQLMGAHESVVHTTRAVHIRKTPDRHAAAPERVVVQTKQAAGSEVCLGMAIRQKIRQGRRNGRSRAGMHGCEL